MYLVPSSLQLLAVFVMVVVGCDGLQFAIVIALLRFFFDGSESTRPLGKMSQQRLCLSDHDLLLKASDDRLRLF